MESIYTEIAEQHDIRPRQVATTDKLLAEGATVPFIARYRKEQTDSLDEVKIISIRNALNRIRELNKRKEQILKSLKERDLLNPELESKIRSAETGSRLEDLYLPYRPKRKTRGSIAIEKGLKPLAKRIFKGLSDDPYAEASSYISAENGVPDAETAVNLSLDIIADWINEEAELRSKLRSLLDKNGYLKSTVKRGKNKEAYPYSDYFAYQESLKKIAPHRIHAVLRGEREGVLKVSVEMDEGFVEDVFNQKFGKVRGNCAELILNAAFDAYKRLIHPSLETERKGLLKDCADYKAIDIFRKNLKDLLLEPPFGQKRLLAVDPGLRTGCKLVCIDEQGNLLENLTVFPLEPHGKEEETRQRIEELFKRHHFKAIAVGNGTGGRGMETFLQTIDFGEKVPVIMVDESGASVYSASEAARREFPDLDLTVRGAISIGRRLQDPLAELVKIDPRSLGVGQYQHDVVPGKLKEALSEVVESCVNAVGVELNSASFELLSYVSGITVNLADKIIEQRNGRGTFRLRKELLDIPGLGPNRFEQAAGFLRIRNGSHVLDSSAVHPERYELVEAIAGDCNRSVNELIGNEELIQSIDWKKYISDEVGMPTLRDIKQELLKPGRDPRSEYKPFSFQEGINAMEDLKPGMLLPGIVTNITAFGAFVDIGVHQDGLVHISELAEKYVRDPMEVVKLHQHVITLVLSVDLERKRIALSMKGVGSAANI